MPIRRLSLLFIALGALLILGVAALWPSQKAQAQCGSQASSCKTCHETQGQLSVNNDGKGWHTGHAFGDFCYSCHGGNNQSMVKEEAHMGMTPPMADVKLACSGCHPDDLQERADKYTAVLGSGASSDGAAAPAATHAPTPAASQAAAPAAAQATPAQAAPVPATPVPAAAPVSGQSSGGGQAPTVPNQPAPIVNNSAAPAGEIDYVARYNQETPINWGNLILAGLIVLVAVVGGGFVYWNERRLAGKPLLGPSRLAESAELPKVPGYPDEVAALLPKIAKLNPVGLHSLKRILENPEQANEMLHCLSHLDPDLIRRVSSLDRDSRSLLMALAGD